MRGYWMHYTKSGLKILYLKLIEAVEDPMQQENFQKMMTTSAAIKANAGYDKNRTMKSIGEADKCKKRNASRSA